MCENGCCVKSVDGVFVKRIVNGRCKVDCSSGVDSDWMNAV